MTVINIAGEQVEIKRWNSEIGIYETERMNTSDQRFAEIYKALPSKNMHFMYWSDGTMSIYRNPFTLQPKYPDVPNVMLIATPEANRPEHMYITGVAEITVEQCAFDYGIQAGTVRRSIHKGWIKARKSGKSWLIKRSDAEARWVKK
jgi:excisionase family DNA binding protein